MPTTRQPLSLAICPTTEPTAPVAAATTTCFAGLRLADFQQPDVRREARHSQDTERMRGGLRAGRQLDESLPSDTANSCQPLPAEHQIADAEIRVARFLDARDGFPS